MWDPTKYRILAGFSTRNYKTHKDWIISANQCEKSLAQRNENIVKKYNVSTRQHPEIPIGMTVAIHKPNLTGY